MLLRTCFRIHHYFLVTTRRLEQPPPSPLAEFLAVRTASLFGLGYALILLVALLNHLAGPELSCSIFYLVPIALGAWWGGFPHGILLALSSTVAWNIVEAIDAPGIPWAVRLWNGVIRFGFFAITSSLLSRLHTALLHEQALARTDALTGVANGRTFYERARQELQRFQRSGRAFTVVYLDLDNFKLINDRHGHTAGDDLLRRVAQAIRGCTRELDLTARMGGDEFALLLPETDADGASTLLVKLREALLRATGSDGALVTCSMGAATFRHAPRDVDAMIQRVDTLMYAVKRDGKDDMRHCIIGPEEELEDSHVRRERRASIRSLDTRTVRVIQNGTPEPNEWLATIAHLSPQGIGLRCDFELPLQALVTVELLDSNHSRALLARVVRGEVSPPGWVYGCELAQVLREEDMRDWCG